MPHFTDELVPDAYYWAALKGSDDLQIVQVSTVFGRQPHHLTVAVMSSEQHYSLEDFDFHALIMPPGDVAEAGATEAL